MSDEYRYSDGVLLLKDGQAIVMRQVLMVVPKTSFCPDRDAFTVYFPGLSVQINSAYHGIGYHEFLGLLYAVNGGSE